MDEEILLEYVPVAIAVRIRKYRRRLPSLDCWPLSGTEILNKIKTSRFNNYV